MFCNVSKYLFVNKILTLKYLSIFRKLDNALEIFTFYLNKIRCYAPIYLKYENVSFTDKRRPILLGQVFACIDMLVAIPMSVSYLTYNILLRSRF